jgi:hypothetical protein
VNGCSEPADVGMPEQSPALPSDREVVDIRLARLQRALSDVGRAIGPGGSDLPHAVPGKKNTFTV